MNLHRFSAYTFPPQNSRCDQLCSLVSAKKDFQPRAGFSNQETCATKTLTVMYSVITEVYLAGGFEQESNEMCIFLFWLSHAGKIYLLKFDQSSEIGPKMPIQGKTKVN